jgi:hypothetical protein
MLEAVSMMGEADYGPTNIIRERSVKTVLQLMLSEGKISLISSSRDKFISNAAQAPECKATYLPSLRDLRSAKESGSEVFRNSILVGHSV